MAKIHIHMCDGHITSTDIEVNICSEFLLSKIHMGVTVECQIVGLRW